MDRATLAVRGQTVLVRQFAVRVLDGVDHGANATSTAEELSIGTNASNDLSSRLAYASPLRAPRRG
jgi:hypothetical protein